MDTHARNSMSKALTMSGGNRVWQRQQPVDLVSCNMFSLGKPLCKPQCYGAHCARPLPPVLGSNYWP
eukprot:6459939-Amphidinium_carterae.2